MYIIYKIAEDGSQSELEAINVASDALAIAAAKVYEPTIQVSVEYKDDGESTSTIIYKTII